MKQYLDVLKDVFENGVGVEEGTKTRDDRTNTGTTALFDREMRFWLPAALSRPLPVFCR